MRHFFSGLVAGFAALSALVGAMAWGGWLHFGPVALHGPQISQVSPRCGVLPFCWWVALKKASFRCYLQFTLTRGINFWWALASIALMCGSLLLRARGNGVWGVYVIALLGLVPCLLLHLNKAPKRRLLAGGLGHLNAVWLRPHRQQRRKLDRHLRRRIHRLCLLRQRLRSPARPGGPLAATPHGTGRKPTSMARPTAAWWRTGHFLTTSTGGNPLWSGGADGPEGSLLVSPICCCCWPGCCRHLSPARTGQFPRIRAGNGSN